MSRSILEASCQSTTSTWGRDSDQLESCNKALNFTSEEREYAVLQIRDVYPGSRIRIFPSRIPDPGSKDSGSRIRTRIKEFKKLFLSFRKSDQWEKDHPGSQIRIFSITDPGSRGQKGTGSRIRNVERKGLHFRVSDLRVLRMRIDT